MGKRWQVKECKEENIVVSLAKELKVSEIISTLLVQRGVKTYEEARSFFNPDFKNTPNPFLMRDMERAVERMAQAIDNSEKIFVYGDYDVDGTTSVALVYSVLKKYTNNIDYYIPDRYAEGYGISIKGIDYMKEQGAKLVIALDCGIKAVDKIEYAKKIDVDFIICDHHTPGDKIPDAVACLDPKRSDCKYPYKHLSGCGVGYKFLFAFFAYYELDQRLLYDYLDLVAVSIASDIVPITGENRTLAYKGLQKLNENPIIGLKHIMKVAKVKESEVLSISDIVFRIGPRINAAGRIDSAKTAVKLMVANDEKLAKDFSLLINKHNSERKDFDRDITQQALDMIANDEELLKRKSTVVFDPSWHKGVIGIVASRLTEVYYRPTVVLTESNGFATGSARSVDGFDLYSAIESCSHLLESFGGHMYAAGLTMKLENIDKFINCFEEYVIKNITEEQLTPQINIDAVIQLQNITPKFYRILKRFEPHGPGNMHPVFASRRVLDCGSKVIGKAGDHLKLIVTEEKSGIIHQGVAFGMGHLLPEIKKNYPFDICYTISENDFYNPPILQLMIKDIKFPYVNEMI